MPDVSWTTQSDTPPVGPTNVSPVRVCVWTCHHAAEAEGFREVLSRAGITAVAEPSGEPEASGTPIEVTVPVDDLERACQALRDTGFEFPRSRTTAPLAPPAAPPHGLLGLLPSRNAMMILGIFLVISLIGSLWRNLSALF